MSARSSKGHAKSTAHWRTPRLEHCGTIKPEHKHHADVEHEGVRSYRHEQGCEFGLSSVGLLSIAQLRQIIKQSLMRLT
eukprot:4649496-Amphidinium_carterae.1